MSNCIEVEGFEELTDLLSDMTISESDEKKAMRKAITLIADEIEKNTPVDDGYMKKSIKKRVSKKSGEGTVGTVKIGAFYSLFQEFGTSKSKKNVGFFERSVNKTKNKALEVLSDELLK